MCRGLLLYPAAVQVLIDNAGVQISPWNFTALMPVWKIAPSLACGCTSVLKASS